MSQTSGIAFDPTKSLTGGMFTPVSRTNQDDYLNKHQQRGYGEGQLNLPVVRDDRDVLVRQDAPLERQGFASTNKEMLSGSDKQIRRKLMGKDAKDRNYVSPNPEGSNKDMAARGLMKADEKIIKSSKNFQRDNERIATRKRDRQAVNPITGNPIDSRNYLETRPKHSQWKFRKKLGDYLAPLGIDNKVPFSKMAIGARIRRAINRGVYNRNVRRYNNIIANAGSDAYYLPGKLKNSSRRDAKWQKNATSYDNINNALNAQTGWNTLPLSRRPLTRKEADYQLKKRDPLFGGPGISKTDKYGYNSYTDNDGTYTNKEVKKTTGYRIPKKRK